MQSHHRFAGLRAPGSSFPAIVLVAPVLVSLLGATTDQAFVFSLLAIPSLLGCTALALIAARQGGRWLVASALALWQLGTIVAGGWGVAPGGCEAAGRLVIFTHVTDDRCVLPYSDR